MKLFNAFQLVIMYAALPFVISWLDGQSFRWHGAAFWSAIAIYVIATFMMVASIYRNFQATKW